MEGKREKGRKGDTRKGNKEEVKGRGIRRKRNGNKEEEE